MEEDTSYVVLNDEGIIENIIVAGEEFAKEIGAYPSYMGADIGKKYDPPSVEKLERMLNDISWQLSTAQQVIVALNNQMMVMSQRNEFLEDCIAEMAMEVYAEEKGEEV